MVRVGVQSLYGYFASVELKYVMCPAAGPQKLTMNNEHKPESDVGKWYCPQCSRFIIRGSLELNGIFIARKCGYGHNILYVAPAWQTGVLGLVLSCSALYFAPEIAVGLPIAGTTYVWCMPILGGLCCLVALTLRFRRYKGVVEPNTVAWRALMGLGMGTFPE